MKKNILLILCSALVIAGISAAGSFYMGQVVQVQTKVLVPTTVENSVTCSGKVERAQENSVYVSSPSCLQKIYVNVGDKVTAGEKLMTVIPVSASAVPTSSLPSLPSGVDYSAYGAYAAYLSGLGGLPSSQGTSSSAPASSAVNDEPKDILAPATGEVVSINGKENDYAAPGQAVMVISGSSDYIVRLSVNESLIPDIKTGQKAIITGSGFKNSTYTGSVKSISSQATQQVSTTGQETVVEVVVNLANCGEDIKPGFTAKSRIITSEDPGTLIVPYESVRANNDGSEYVYTFVKGKAHKTKIVTGNEYENGFQVKSGLKAGDIIIMNPDAVSNGKRVLVSDKGTVSSDD